MFVTNCMNCVKDTEGNFKKEILDNEHLPYQPYFHKCQQGDCGMEFIQKTQEYIKEN